jgi:nitrogen regulatory protein P-II 1
MYKIEAIVREEKYEEIKDILNVIGVYGITVTQVMGCGMQKGYESIVRGTKVDVNMLPKIKFEIVTASKEWAEKTIEAIAEIAFTGNIGDGKIFMYKVQDVVRISTGQRGPDAIC